MDLVRYWTYLLRKIKIAHWCIIAKHPITSGLNQMLELQTRYHILTYPKNKTSSEELFKIYGNGKKSHWWQCSSKNQSTFLQGTILKCLWGFLSLWQEHSQEPRTAATLPGLETRPLPTVWLWTIYFCPFTPSFLMSCAAFKSLFPC